MHKICETLSPDIDKKTKTTMTEEPNNPTGTPMEIPAGSKGQSTRFMAMEELMVTMAYSWV